MKTGMPAWVAAALMALWAAPAAASLSAGLQGYWQFEDSGADASGQGRDVVLAGGAGYGTGRLGRGLLLDGQTGSHAIRTASDGAFDLPGDFSIQVWVNPAEVGREQTLIEKFQGGSGPGWTLTFLGGQFFASGVGAPINSVPVAGFGPGSWHQVLLIRAGDLFSVWYDGVAGPTASSAGTISPSANPLLFGARNAGDGRNFTLDGVLDEVAIWNRALSAAEVAALWNSGQGLALNAAPTGVPAPSAVALFALGAVALALARPRGVLAVPMA